MKINSKEQPCWRFAVACVAVLIGLITASRQSSTLVYSQASDRERGVRIVVSSGQQIRLYDKSYALIIGVSHYINGWIDLPGVLEDVRAVRMILEKNGFVTREVLDPTRQVFDREMSDFIGQHGQAKDNRLVIYFAGHGYTLTTGDGKHRQMGYIVPSDAPVPYGPDNDTGEFKRFAINMTLVDTYARDIESKHALFVFDSCFSGLLFKTRSGVLSDAISVKTQEPVRQFITAGSALQSVPDRSIFRRQFVAALDGEGDIDCDGFVTGTELGEFLFRTVTNYSKRSQTPQHGKINDPDLDRGDMVFKCPNKTVSCVRQAKSPDGRTNQGLQTLIDPERNSALETGTGEQDPGGWALVEQKNITVQGNALWTPALIKILAGQQVTVNCGNNQINLGSNGYSGPDGVYKDDPQRPVRKCPTGALVARVGGQTICLGRTATFTSTVSGDLSLGINEGRTSDNTGSFVVRVRLYQLKE